MSAGRTTRRRELLKVAGALAAVLVGTAIVSRMLVAAWDAHGLAFHIGHGIAQATGFGIDGVVVFAAVLALTWVVFFTLDDDKHLPGAMLLLAVFLVFVPSLVLMDRWATTVDFLGHPIAAISAIVVGTLVVALDANVPTIHGGGRLRFTMAARALYGTTVFVLVIGFIERHVVYRSPFIALDSAAAPVATTAGPFILIVEAVAVGAIVYLVGYFVRYSDVTRVVLSSPNEEALTSFLGGLYAEADVLYGARPVSGGHILNSARSARHSQPRLDSKVSFRYRPGNLLGRWREVAYENIRPVSDQDIGPLREIADERSSFGTRLWLAFKYHLRLSAPGFLQGVLRGSGGHHLDRITRADTILLIAPVSDVLREPAGNPVTEEAISERRRDRRYLQIYDEICGICSRKTMPNVLVVATDAADALEEHESDRITSAQFIRFVRKDVLGLGQNCRVVPVDRDGEHRDGFSDLLDLF